MDVIAVAYAAASLRNESSNYYCHGPGKKHQAGPRRMLERIRAERMDGAGVTDHDLGYVWIH